MQTKHKHKNDVFKIKSNYSIPSLFHKTHMRWWNIVFTHEIRSENIYTDNVYGMSNDICIRLLKIKVTLKKVLLVIGRYSIHLTLKKVL